MMDHIAEKRSLFLQSPLFSKLRENEIDILAHYSEFIEHAGGDCIFNAGDRADSLYLIAKGEVLITKIGKEAGERDVARYLPGECFGELPLFRSSLQDAAAIALIDSVLLRFPSASCRFRDIAESHAPVFANILYKLIAIIAGRIRSTNRLINEKTPWLHELKRNLYTDKLTGIFNKNYLDEDFPDSIFSMDTPVSLLMIKPDNFKLVNDNYGHDAGDRVLRLMTIFIQSMLRENDLAVRFRGDEFVTILTGTGTEDAIVFAREMQHTIYSMDLSNALQSADFHITTSIGIVSFPGEAGSAEELIIKAHGKMMEAWLGGGGSIKSGTVPEKTDAAGEKL